MRARNRRSSREGPGGSNPSPSSSESLALRDPSPLRLRQNGNTLSRPGTDGSNPAPSRGGSANPRSLPKSAPGYKVAPGFVIQNKYTDAPVRVPRCDREPRQRHALIEAELRVPAPLQAHPRRRPMRYPEVRLKPTSGRSITTYARAGVGNAMELGIRPNRSLGNPDLGRQT